MNPPPDSPMLPNFKTAYIPIDKNGDPWMGLLTTEKPTFEVDGYEWRHFQVTEIIEAVKDSPKPLKFGGFMDLYMDAIDREHAASSDSPAVPAQGGESSKFWITDRKTGEVHKGPFDSAEKAERERGFMERGDVYDDCNLWITNVPPQPPVADSLRPQRYSADCEAGIPYMLADDSGQFVGWEEHCEEVNRLERELAEARSIITKVEAVLDGYVATYGFDDGTLESKVECLLLRAEEQDQLEAIINRAAGLPPIEDPEEGVIRLQDRADEAKQDSERLEWLLATRWLNNEHFTRAEIDAAMREGEES